MLGSKPGRDQNKAVR